MYKKYCMFICISLDACLLNVSGKPLLSYCDKQKFPTNFQRASKEARYCQMKLLLTALKTYLKNYPLKILLQLNFSTPIFLIGVNKISNLKFRKH